jgi:hypothetical protein
LRSPKQTMNTERTMNELKRAIFSAAYVALVAASLGVLTRLFLWTAGIDI